MMVSWNVMGFNKEGKLRDISCCLLELRPDVVVLIETRVKANKVKVVRDKLNLNGKYLYNYQFHDNDIIWVEWDNNEVDIRHVKGNSQFIHYGVYDVKGMFKYWLTVVYGQTQLEHKRNLWKDIDILHSSQQGPWCVIGDFNNVAKNIYILPSIHLDLPHS